MPARDLGPQPRLRRVRDGHDRRPARLGAWLGHSPRRRQHVGLLPARAPRDRGVRERHRRCPAPVRDRGRGDRRADRSDRAAAVRLPRGVCRRLARRREPAARLLGTERAGIRADGRVRGRRVPRPDHDRHALRAARARRRAAHGPPRLGRVRGADGARDVLELRRRARDPRAAARARAAAPAHARAPVHLLVRRLRGSVCAAVRARRTARLGPTVLGPAADAQDRGPGAPGAHLGGPSTELSPDRDDDPAADCDRGRAARDRGLGRRGGGGSARAPGASASRSHGSSSRSRSRSSIRWSRSRCFSRAMS